MRLPNTTILLGLWGLSHINLLSLTTGVHIDRWLIQVIHE